MSRFVAVPRVYEKMHQQLEMALNDAKGAKAALVKWATQVSNRHYNDILAGGAGKGLQYKMAEKLLLLCYLSILISLAPVTPTSKSHEFLNGSGTMHACRPYRNIA